MPHAVIRGHFEGSCLLQLFLSWFYTFNSHTVSFHNTFSYWHGLVIITLDWLAEKRPPLISPKTQDTVLVLGFFNWSSITNYTAPPLADNAARLHRHYSTGSSLATTIIYSLCRTQPWQSRRKQIWSGQSHKGIRIDHTTCYCKLELMEHRGGGSSPVSPPLQTAWNFVLARRLRKTDRATYVYRKYTFGGGFSPVILPLPTPLQTA